MAKINNAWTIEETEELWARWMKRSADTKLTFFAEDMGADESKMGYVQQRHNAMDVHMLGAMIVRDGKPTLLNRFTDWEMLLRVK